MFEGVKELFGLSAGFKPVTYHIKAEKERSFTKTFNKGLR